MEKDCDRTIKFDGCCSFRSLKELVNKISKKYCFDENEEKEILNKYIETKNIYYRNKLLYNNFKLILKIAYDVVNVFKLFTSNTSINVNELFQEGVYLFLKYIDSYKPEFMTKINTYITMKLKYDLLDFCNKNNHQLSVNKYTTRKYFMYLEATEFLNSNNKPLTEENYQAYFKDKNMSFKDIDKVIQSMTSINKEIEISDYQYPDNSDIDKRNESELNDSVLSAVKKLNKPYRDVVIYIYGLFNKKQHTIEEAMVKFNLSRYKLKDLLSKAFLKLKSDLSNKI